MKKSFLLFALLSFNFGIWTLNSTAQGVCFKPVTNYAAGNCPAPMCIADFNGDGKPDFAVPNNCDNTVSILLNNGSGIFGAPINLGAGSGNGVWQVCSADFNGDGKADIAVIDNNVNTVTVYLGNGAGGFGPGLALPTGSGPEWVISADFNGDGKKDLAVANWNDQTISIYLGNGSGGFATAVTTAALSGRPNSMVNADMNGDGKQDLVVADYGNGTIDILLGNNDGTFQSPSTTYSGNSPSNVVVADFNADGKLDVAASNRYSNNLSVLLGNGNGTLNSATTFNTGSQPYGIVTADFNGDGNLDLAVNNNNNATVSVLLGNGNGSFGTQAVFNIGNSPYNIVCADFNGDGKPDLATPNNNDGNVSVLLNTTAPTVAASVSPSYTVCPGTSVILSGSGAGQAHTVTYQVPFSSLTNCPNSCGAGSYYGTNPGFTWTGTEPGGAIINSVTIQANIGVDCSGGSHSATLNTHNIGSQSDPSWCSCATRNQIVTYNVNPSNYVVGGSNSFQTFGNTFGFSNNTNWSSGIYAIVTVTYNNPYTWTGGVNDGIAFVPGSTAAYSVYATTPTGCVSNISTVTVTVLPATSPTVTPTDASCVCNGSANISVSGGTGAISYSWSNGNTTTATSGLCAGNYTVNTTDSKGCKSSTPVTINAAPSMIFSPTSADATCNCNGTSAMAISGGTSPYTFSWSNGATTSSVTGLCAGTYTLTATDSYSVGCQNVSIVSIANTQSVTVSSESHINASCSAACNGGAAVTITNGASPVTYAWSTSPIQTTASASSLCANTTYTLTATDANGCKTVSESVIGITPMVLSTLNTNANCSTSCNGTSSASVNGGKAPYTYAWSNGGTNAMATGLCAGSTYTLTVTDASGCNQVTTTSIDGNPVANIASFSTTFAACKGVCNGTAVPVVSGGTAPYTYLWSNGNTTSTATGLCASTSYTLTVKDVNGCGSVATTTVTADPNPLQIDPGNFITTNASCNSVCNGTAYATVYNGSGSYHFLWMPGGATTQTASHLCGSNNGNTYTVTVTDGLGCKAKDSTNAVIYLQNQMSFNTNLNAATCAAACNGVASISNLTNGTHPYSYHWSNGSTTTIATGLCGSNNGINYTLTITDSVGCHVKDTVDFMNVINQNNLISVTPSISNAMCSAACDGMATINNFNIGGNSTPPYTYLWSNGKTTSSVSNLCVGTYPNMATVTDAVGCKAMANITIGNGNNGVSIDYNTTNNNIVNTFCNASCSGSISGTINVGTGTPPYMYKWFPGGQTTATVTGLCASDYTLTVTDANGCSDQQSWTVGTNSSVNFSFNENDATCNQRCDGNIMVTNPTGGTPPFSYLWNTGSTTASVTGLCGNYTSGITYTCTVKDANGCTTRGTQRVYANISLSISTTKTNASCNLVCNGKDSVTSVNGGGKSPYTYSWVPSGGTNSVATGLCANYNNGVNYSVTVTDSLGCKAVKSDLVYANASPSLNFTTTNAVCNTSCNGTAAATPVGGTQPFNYTWSTGATTESISNLCSGAYNLSVIDSKGCAVVSNFNISATSASTLTTTVSSVSPSCHGVCDGTASALVAGGTAPYAYHWLPSGGSVASTASLCAGNYSVNVTDINGCAQTSVFNIIQPSVLVTNVTGVNPVSCVSGNGSATANVSGGTAPYGYNWTPTGQITQVAVVLPNGIYSVTVTDSKGCTAIGATTISCSSGVNELSDPSIISIYPNPSNGMVEVSVTTGNINAIEVLNLLGQRVYLMSNERTQMSNSVDLSSQSSGVYFMRVNTELGTATKKIIIEK